MQSSLHIVSDIQTQHLSMNIPGGEVSSGYTPLFLPAAQDDSVCNILYTINECTIHIFHRIAANSVFVREGVYKYTTDQALYFTRHNPQTALDVENTSRILCVHNNVQICL